MFDEYAKNLIATIPDLPGLNRDDCRRTLSKAFFYVVRFRLAAGNAAFDADDFKQTCTLLRRLADALESVAVFDPLNGIQVQPAMVSASAFVGAEALSLLSALSASQPTANTPIDPIQVAQNYVAVEAGLLYMIGGYDINAATAIHDIVLSAVPQGNDINTAIIANGQDLLDRIMALCRGDVRPANPVPFTGTDKAPPLYQVLVGEVRIRCYEQLSVGIREYLAWLGGEVIDYDAATHRIHQVLHATASAHYPGYTAFADVYHISALLLATLDNTSRRSTVHSVPPCPPNGGEGFTNQFTNYLLTRARGDVGQFGRPFLWPSATEYIKDCLPGPAKDAVIAMPTGSGKSFVAELAIAHALATGSVIYLAPTNALVHQVRRDLQHALKPFDQVRVLAFVGNEEYTTLSEEQVVITDERFVAVMTPEKCALAMKLHPHAFNHCSLCVFDECHLLNDEHRGATADFLIAQLLLAVPNLRFVLMSAMVSNPEELAAWLNQWRPGQATAKIVTWRPSRTLRGLLVLDAVKTDEAFKAAEAELKLRPKRKNIEFDAPLALIAGLSGPWTLDGPADYTISRIPVTYTAAATRKRALIQKKFEGWKNTSARLLAEQFARCGMPVINFILTSKHHVFSAAADAATNVEAPPGGDAALPEIIGAWLNIAEAELGVESALRSLLSKGVAVHTSVMLHEERLAAEWMFTRRKVLLMFATGTLAQGLNLPAVVVIIAGTSLGDPRKASQLDREGGARANSIILNGFGRAGRPGFSSQGVAILVTDTPFSAPISSNLNPALALNKYKVLGFKDAALYVHSPIEPFLDKLLGNIDAFQPSTDEELTLTTLLGEVENEEHISGQLIQRTFAAFHKRQILTPETSIKIGQRMISLKHELLQAPNMPQWMNTAAMKAGVDFARAWKMWSCYSIRGIVTPRAAESMGVVEWLRVFFEVMMQMPPKRILQYVANDELKTTTVLTRMRDYVKAQRGLDDVPWSFSDDWVKCWQDVWQLVTAFMGGKTYSKIAQGYLGIGDGEISNGRSPRDPIPVVFALIRKVIDPLAIDAGCFVAINQFALSPDSNSPVPVVESLAGLPLCIRNGCDSLSTLAWFRFGIRQRVCAHAFSQLLPTPAEASTDSQRARWVWQTKRQWLKGQVQIDENSNPIIQHARTVLLSEG